MTRQRLIAIVTVNAAIAAAIGAAIAWADPTITSSPEDTHVIPANTAAHVVFSIRNTFAVPATFATPTLANIGACTSVGVQLIGSGSFPLTVGSNQQFQIMMGTGSGFSGSGGTITDSCGATLQYTDGSNGGASQPVGQFTIGAGSSHDIADVQPRMMDFATPATSEDQTIAITNYGASFNSVVGTITGDATNSILFETSGCAPAQTCALPTGPLANGQFTEFIVRCAPQTSNLINATVSFTGSATPLGSTTVTCNDNGGSGSGSGSGSSGSGSDGSGSGGSSDGPDAGARATTDAGAGRDARAPNEDDGNGLANLYACGCRGTHDPSGALAILLALTLVLRRRRA
jgi:hypothetical protein